MNNTSIECQPILWLAFHKYQHLLSSIFSPDTSWEYCCQPLGPLHWEAKAGHPSAYSRFGGYLTFPIGHKTTEHHLGWLLKQKVMVTTHVLLTLCQCDEFCSSSQGSVPRSHPLEGFKVSARTTIAAHIEFACAFAPLERDTERQKRRVWSARLINYLAGSVHHGGRLSLSAAWTHTHPNPLVWCHPENRMYVF